MSAEVADVAAAVSEMACHAFPSSTRVDRILDDATPTIEVTTNINAETEPPPVGLDVDSFWPDDCALPEETKRSLFWQYHRSMGCHEFSAALAIVLKGLCDNGVGLTHHGKPVVDLLVLNTTELDVSDVLAVRGGPSASLRMHDPVTDLTLPVVATHETMDRMTDVGESVCHRLGMRMPARATTNRARLKRHRPESYAGTVPHWWVAAVVADEASFTMVHLDVCGAAYDPSALVRAPGSGELVSLQVFSTPEYCMTPSGDENLPHKLVMKAFLSDRAETTPGPTTRVVLQPRSVRHFRCYHRNDTSVIEATPLGTFVERNPLANDSRLGGMMRSLERDILLRLPVGSEVIVCNLQSKPELNGRRGVVHQASAKIKIASDRVPVRIQGLEAPLQLKATCIRLPPVERIQYVSLEERLRKHEASMKEVKAEVASADDLSKNQKSHIRGAMNADDPAIAKVIAVMQSGQMTFSCFGDPEFKRGVGMFLRPPLDAVLPAPMKKTMQSGLELSNHPKAGDAIKLINILKAGKQRFLQEHPCAVSGNGGLAVAKGSDLERMYASVVNKIRSDEGLYFVFERLEQLGLYVNPATAK